MGTRQNKPRRRKPTLHGNIQKTDLSWVKLASGKSKGQGLRMKGPGGSTLGRGVQGYHAEIKGSAAATENHNLNTCQPIPPLKGTALLKEFYFSIAMEEDPKLKQQQIRKPPKLRIPGLQV